MEKWDRQPDETAKAFAAFQGYLQMGPEVRSLAGAYRQNSGRKQAKQAPGLWTGWYTLHRWKERAQAWDAHMVQIERHEAEAERLKKRRQRRALLDRGAYNTLIFNQKLDPNQFNPAELSPAELVEAVGRLTRATASLADQLRIEYGDLPAKRVQHSGPNGGPVAIEDARERLAQKIQIYLREETN